MSNPNIREINNNPGGVPVIVTWEIMPDGSMYGKADGIVSCAKYYPDEAVDKPIIDAMFPNGYVELEPKVEQGLEVTK